MSVWQAVFFDFDGVILDSVDVKTQAFAQMFRKHGPEVERAVVEYHLTNGGISRFEKFRHYYEVLLGQPISEVELVSLGEEFSRIVFEQVLCAPYIAGALETLEKLLKESTPAYVVSGTPEEELGAIVERRGLTRFFLGVYGSPKTKMQILAEIMHKKRYTSERCLFLGDAMTDYEAAHVTAVRFLGIVRPGGLTPFPPGTPISFKVTDAQPVAANGHPPRVGFP